MVLPVKVPRLSAAADTPDNVIRWSTSSDALVTVAAAVTAMRSSIAALVIKLTSLSAKASADVWIAVRATLSSVRPSLNTSVWSISTLSASILMI